MVSEESMTADLVEIRQTRRCYRTRATRLPGTLVGKPEPTRRRAYLGTLGVHLILHEEGACEIDWRTRPFQFLHDEPQVESFWPLFHRKRAAHAFGR